MGVGGRAGVFAAISTALGWALLAFAVAVVTVRHVGQDRSVAWVGYWGAFGVAPVALATSVLGVAKGERGAWASLLGAGVLSTIVFGLFLLAPWLGGV